MKRLEEQQHGEEGDELWIEVVPEDGERQTGLSECVPETLHQMFELCRPQSPQENLKAGININMLLDR